MKAYKGFDSKMKCRGFQYKEGETYKKNEASLCSSGFHACEDALDCLSYYNPADGAEYHEVELDDVSPERGEDSKICGKRIKIGAKLEIGDLIDASVKSSLEKTKDADEIAKGNRSKAASSGGCSTAASSGGCSTAASSGEYSAAASSGECSTAASSGSRSKAASSGNHSKAASSGNRSKAASSGEYSTATSSGEYSTASVKGKNTVAVAIGKDGKVKGDIGSWLIATEYGEYDGNGYPCIGVVSAQIDGTELLPDTWYKARNGKFVKAE